MKFITFLTTTLLAILTLSPEAFAQSNPPKCPPGEMPVTHLMSQIKSNIMKLYVKDITHIDDASGCVSKNALNLITTFDTIKLYKKYNPSSKLSNASIDNDINTGERILKMLKNDPEYPLIISDFISLQFPNLQIVEKYSFAGNSTIEGFRHPSILIVGDFALVDSDISNVSLPNAIIIGDYAFADCNHLQTVNLPNAVLIGEGAFAEARSIASLQLPNATTIQASAFSYAKQLRHLELTTPNPITLGHIFERPRDSKNIDLVLNKNKSPNGNSSPKATDATHWAGYEWKSITYK